MNSLDEEDDDARTDVSVFTTSTRVRYPVARVRLSHGDNKRGYSKGKKFEISTTRYILYSVSTTRYRFVVKRKRSDETGAPSGKRYIYVLVCVCVCVNE